MVLAFCRLCVVIFIRSHLLVGLSKRA